MSGEQPLVGSPRYAARTKALMLGCEGPTLLPREAALFDRVDPFGFILFRRNCVSKQQLARLIADLRVSVGRADAPVAIDQEGGRVLRLRTPTWWEAPAPATIGKLADSDPAVGKRAAWIAGRLNAAQLNALGVTINVTPSLDLQLPGKHTVIGDRAYHADPEVVVQLGSATIEAHLDGGVLPVIKHMPGHGRTMVDSHEQLPHTDASVAELDMTDFKPFVALANSPLGMTCHMAYSAVDPGRPATHSKTVIEEIIRKRLRFAGLLLTDDISMNALGGAVGTRCELAVEAGCDVVVHCNGKFAEMQEIASVAPPLSESARARIDRLGSWSRVLRPFDLSALSEELTSYLPRPCR